MLISMESTTVNPMKRQGFSMRHKGTIKDTDECCKTFCICRAPTWAQKMSADAGGGGFTKVTSFMSSSVTRPFFCHCSPCLMNELIAPSEEMPLLLRMLDGIFSTKSSLSNQGLPSCTGLCHLPVLLDCNFAAPSADRHLFRRGSWHRSMICVYK